jgi:membrane protease subunit HflK
VLIDKNASGTGGVVPYLPLPELRSNQPPGTVPPRAPPAPSAQAQGATR